MMKINRCLIYFYTIKIFFFFKFYKDTLETDEDKEQKERENSDEDAKKEKEETIDDQKESRIFKTDIDDDARSNSKLFYFYLLI